MGNRFAEIDLGQVLTFQGKPIKDDFGELTLRSALAQVIAFAQHEKKHVETLRRCYFLQEKLVADPSKTKISEGDITFIKNIIGDMSNVVAIIHGQILVILDRAEHDLKEDEELETPRVGKAQSRTTRNL